MPRLRIKSGREEGRIIDVSEQTVTIGRDEESTIILHDTAASRHHAEIFMIGKMCFIKDLDSKNGSFVNNDRIKEELLQEGDRIQVASTIVAFESDHHIEHELQDVESNLGAIDFTGPTTEFSLEEIGLGNLRKTNDATSESLAAIYHLSKVVSTERNEGQLLEKTATLVRDLIKADGVYFFTSEGKNHSKLTLRAKDEGEGVSLNMVSRSIVKRVLQFGKAILTSDASTDERFNVNESVIVNKIHSTTCAPLLSRGQVVGVVYSLKLNLHEVFNEQDLELLTLTGIQVGIALDNFLHIKSERKHMTELLHVMVNAIELRQPDLKGHGARVAQYSRAMAKTLGLSASAVQEVYWAALLHEVGRLGDNSTESTDSVYETENHTYIAESLIKDISDIPDILPAIQYMHERLDGTGFPYKKEGDDIPIEAQILGVANAFDMLTTFGPVDGNGPLDSKDALLAIQDLAGAVYREDVCNSLQGAYSNGSLFIATKAT